MNIGFLVRFDEQGVGFHQVGEAAAGAPPLLSQAGDENGRVVFLGRLYYGNDLRRRLDADRRPAADGSAAAHVLAAYRQAGIYGLSWLEGDYAFVVWDAREQRLLAARDPQGGFPIYWARDREAIVLCTAMRPLLDRLPQRTLDRDYVADYLMFPGTGVQELNGERCAYEGIHRVPAGTRLEIRPGRQTELVRWWDWLDRLEEPASLQHADIAARFGALFEDAVGQRRVGRTAAHLSGGMDSTAVALLAARQAHAAGDEPVHGLSMVYERFTVLSRERPYVEAALGGPGLEPHLLPGDRHIDFEGYRDDVNSDEPALVLYQSTSNQAMLQHAADIGAKTLMTGFGADELIGQPPFHLHDLLRRGRWLAAWRESARWARAANSNRWKFLGMFGLTPLFPARLRGGLKCWWQRGRVPWEKQHEFTVGPWVRPEFARRYGLWDRAVARLHRVTHRCRPLTRSLTLEFLDLNVGDALRWSMGIPRGVHTVHPFRDPRLVRFCLGFQGRIWGDPTRQKPILADAVPGLLPKVIGERPRKGHFNEIFFAGLSRNLPVLESLVRTADVDDELFDKQELLRCLHKGALGIAEHSQGVDRLNLTLGLLKWQMLQKTALREPGPPLRALEAPPAAVV